jgi:hypothetical protein
MNFFDTHYLPHYFAPWSRFLSLSGQQGENIICSIRGQYSIILRSSISRGRKAEVLRWSSGTCTAFSEGPGVRGRKKG